MYLCPKQKRIMSLCTCVKTKELCLYVLMSKTKRNKSLCSYVWNKKKYVFVFLCLKQKRICLCVLVMKIKSSLPRVGRVARSAGRVFFSTPSVLSSIGLVPLCYGDSLKLMSKTKKEYVFMFLCLKLKINMSLCSCV